MKENPVRDLFTYDDVKKESKCLIDGCGKIYKGNHAENLEEHVRKAHPNKHNDLRVEKEDIANKKKIKRSK